MLRQNAPFGNLSNPWSSVWSLTYHPGLDSCRAKFTRRPVFCLGNACMHALPTRRNRWAWPRAICVNTSGLTSLASADNTHLARRTYLLCFSFAHDHCQHLIDGHTLLNVKFTPLWSSHGRSTCPSQMLRDVPIDLASFFQRHHLHWARCLNLDALQGLIAPHQGQYVDKLAKAWLRPLCSSFGSSTDAD